MSSYLCMNASGFVLRPCRQCCVRVFLLLNIFCTHTHASAEYVSHAL